MTTLALPGPPPCTPADWVRGSLSRVLVLAAVLCLWNLTISGYSNEYYAAAARAGSESWKAWFFGAIDPGSFITVDKPPLSLWLMGLSARVFGFSSFSVLLPQALCTIAAVGAAVRDRPPRGGRRAGRRRRAGARADARSRSRSRASTTRTRCSSCCWSPPRTARARDRVRPRQAPRLGGALVGLAFMTKMLQGWMIVPALAAAYLVAGPPRCSVRVRQLLVAGVVMVAVSAAWPLAVSLWPGAKPYIGGSTDGACGT